MMNYMDEWKALSSRIHGLVEAGRLFADFTAFQNSDSFGTAGYLRGRAVDVRNSVEYFWQAFRPSLPPEALQVLDNFVMESDDLFQEGKGRTASDHVKALLVRLAAFEAEMSYALTDMQEAIRSQTELAFEHLQRTIVVDDEFRAKWQKVFAKGEAECERHGAVHLLQFGIWAFKAHTREERTDLVHQEPIGDLTEVRRFAKGIVHTEWKKANDDDDPMKLCEEARHQAKLYGVGLLGGIELRAIRYVIVVSGQRVSVPGDHAESGVVYCHINIAVKPDKPSLDARRQRGGNKAQNQP